MFMFIVATTDRPASLFIQVNGPACLASNALPVWGVFVGLFVGQSGRIDAFLKRAHKIIFAPVTGVPVEILP